MIIRACQSSGSYLARLSRNFSHAGHPFTSETLEVASTEAKANIALHKYESQASRGNKIEFREVKLPLLFHQNAGTQKILKENKLTIVSVPQDSLQLTGQAELMEMLKKIGSKEKPVLLPLDPTRYLYQSRLISNMFDQKLNNAENPFLKQDPIWMRDTAEVNLDANVLNHYYKAYLQTQKDSQPEQKKSVSLEDLEREASGQASKEELAEDLYMTHLKQLADVQGNTGGQKELEVIANNMNGCLRSLLFSQGAYPVFNDLERLSGSLASGYIGGAYLWQPSQLLYRIMLASNMDTQTLMSEFLDFAEEYVQLSKSGKPHTLSFEDFIKYSAFNKFAVHNAIFAVAYLEQFVFENETLPVMLADSITCAHLETFLEENYDQTLRYSDFKDLRAVSDSEMQSELVKRHALLDVIFDHKLWAEGFVTNEFCYVNLNKGRIGVEESKRLQKQYFLAYKKLSAAKSRLKMEAGGSAFDLSTKKSSSRRSAAVTPHDLDQL